MSTMSTVNDDSARSIVRSTMAPFQAVRQHSSKDFKNMGYNLIDESATPVKLNRLNMSPPSKAIKLGGKIGSFGFG